MNGAVHQWLQFAQLAAGIVILTAGGIQCALAHPFRRDRNAALGMLGFTGLLYGTRLLSGTPEIRSLIPASSEFWAYLDTWITYVILVPILFFFEHIFGPGWRQSIRWLRIAATVYAAAAIAFEAVTRTPRVAKTPNGYLVIAMIVLVVVNSLRVRTADFPGIRVVRAGVVVFGLFVFFENVVNDRFLQGMWKIEWAGVLVLLGCLGYAAVSWAMDNDRRLHELRHELETARQIQASILPSAMPAIAGLDLGARYLPMTAVAGDFYDVIDLGDGRIGVLVADVSGHGVPAALIASMVKVAFAAQSACADDPARVLAGMNQVFCGLLERQFVTAAYAYVDAAGERLRYAAAGHPSSLLVARGGEVDELAENGVMLGHFPDWHYSFVERPFRSGDRVILYTDGLTEATDPGGVFFDGERLRAFADDNRNHGADAFAGALLTHVSAWSGRRDARGFDDDLTIVVIDRTV
jgi:phosphoserine phosphatase RsbU/P